MFHTIIIAGNVGRDPEMRYTPSGNPVTSFSVASSRSYSQNGQTVKETIWFRVTCWNKLAEVANNYVRKGSKVLVEGRLVADSATGGPRVFTRQDGTTGSSYEISASTLRLLSSRGEGEGFSGANGGMSASSSNGGTTYQDYSDAMMDENEIPF